MFDFLNVPSCPFSLFTENFRETLRLLLLECNYRYCGGRHSWFVCAKTSYFNRESSFQPPLTRSTTFTTIHQHSVTSNVPVLLKRRINPVLFLPRYSRFLSSLRLRRRVLPRPHASSILQLRHDFHDINKSYRFIVPADFVTGCTKVF